MIYRFYDEINSVRMDYVIFFRQNEIEIDILAKIKPTVHHSAINIFSIFNIINNKIIWENVDNQMVSIACQNYCNKIQKLRAFA